MLIRCHALLNGNQQLVRNPQSRLFAWLKGWNRCSQAACCTIIAGLNDRQVHTIIHHVAFDSDRFWCMQRIVPNFGTSRLEDLLSTIRDVLCRVASIEHHA